MALVAAEQGQDIKSWRNADHPTQTSENLHQGEKGVGNDPVRTRQGLLKEGLTAGQRQNRCEHKESMSSCFPYKAGWLPMAGHLLQAS